MPMVPPCLLLYQAKGSWHGTGVFHDLSLPPNLPLTLYPGDLPSAFWLYLTVVFHIAESRQHYSLYAQDPCLPLPTTHLSPDSVQTSSPPAWYSTTSGLLDTIVLIYHIIVNIQLALPIPGLVLYPWIQKKTVN